MWNQVIGFCFRTWWCLCSCFDVSFSLFFQGLQLKEGRNRGGERRSLLNDHKSKVKKLTFTVPKLQLSVTKLSTPFNLAKTVQLHPVYYKMPCVQYWIFNENKFISISSFLLFCSQKGIWYKELPFSLVASIPQPTQGSCKAGASPRLNWQDST